MRIGAGAHVPKSPPLAVLEKVLEESKLEESKAGLAAEEKVASLNMKSWKVDNESASDGRCGVGADVT
jgi:hypothetical protein